MTPTTKLRFVKRTVFLNQQKTEVTFKFVLQQWWAESQVNIGWATLETGKGEWRDVEVEDETN